MTKAENGKRLVSGFKKRHEEKWGGSFYVNFGMYVSAEKVGQFYSAPQIDAALDYYFQMGPGKDLYDFLRKIDIYLSSSEDEEELMEGFEKRKKDTEKQVKKIMKQRLGRKT